MTENMKRWLELLSSDEGLRNGLTMLNGMPREEAVGVIVEKASERGIALSEDDFNVSAGELSDDELEAVAGGGCGCPVIGGGTGTDTGAGTYYGCGCVAVGGGGMDRDVPKCFCDIIGGGVD